MKTIIVDSDINITYILRNYLENLEDIDYNTILVSGDYTSAGLASDLESRLQTEDILFINVNLFLEKSFRQSQKGLELLTWLRVKGVMNHCLLYSFQSAEVIARASEQARLLFSFGTTFVQLPTSFSNFNEEKIKYLCKNKAYEENIKKNIKPLFNVGDFRHRDANWWGIKQLWDVHRIYTEGEFTKEYPQKVNENLLSLNNAIGSYLNELEIASLNKEIEKLAKSIGEIKKREEAEKIPLKNEQSQKREEKDYYESEFDHLRQQYVEKLQLMMQNSRYFAGNRSLYESVKEEAEILEKKKKHAEKLIADVIYELNDTSIDIDKLSNKYRQIIRTSYSNLKKLFSPNLEVERLTNSKILIIDDEVKNGWLDIFKEMLPKANFGIFEPEKSYKGKIENLYNNEVKDKISEFNPDLILLDLRLFAENDRSIDTEKLSGRELLEFIKQDFKSVPILITTASNKIWTYQSLINMGADAYWIKEGIDEQRDVKDSIQNYCRLVFLINRLTDEKYKSLKKLTDFTVQFKNFSSPSNYWAKIGKWSNGDPRNADIDGILKNLNESILIFRKYLHNFHLLENNQNKTNEAFLISGLINKIASAYENIHQLTEEQRRQTKTVIEDIRKDTNSKDLRELRNDVSHYDYEKKATWENLEKAIDLAEIYLRTPQ